MCSSHRQHYRLCASDCSAVAAVLQALRLPLLARDAAPVVVSAVAAQLAVVFSAPVAADVPAVAAAAAAVAASVAVAVVAAAAVPALVAAALVVVAVVLVAPLAAPATAVVPVVVASAVDPAADAMVADCLMAEQKKRTMLLRTTMLPLHLTWTSQLGLLVSPTLLLWDRPLPQASNPTP